MLDWMKHKLESRLLGEIPITSYTDSTTTLMAESEEELKSLLMKVKEESRKVELKLNLHVGGFPFLHTLSSIYCLQIFGSQPF